MRSRLRGQSGQSVAEMAMMLPIIVTLSLGVIEIGYALLDQHVVAKMSREGSNLISRDASIQFAFQALQSMRTGNVDFTSTSKVIFTVVKQPTSGTNAGVNVVAARYTGGAAVGGASAIACGGCSGNLGGPPDYQAADPDNTASLRVTAGVPAGSIGPGGYLYITEIYTNHPLITPFDRLGIAVPSSLYSIAYF
jgi:Flp pilus assembly protein TadG